MTTLMCRIEVQPGQEQAFEAMQQTMWAATVQEPHNRMYQNFRGQNPREYYCIMSFDHYRGFIDHQTTPLHDQAPWGELIASLSMIWLDPVVGASSLAPSVPEAIPSDDPIVLKYLDMFRYERAAWWPKP